MIHEALAVNRSQLFPWASRPITGFRTSCPNRHHAPREKLIVHNTDSWICLPAARWQFAISLLVPRIQCSWCCADQSIVGDKAWKPRFLWRPGLWRESHSGPSMEPHSTVWWQTCGLPYWLHQRDTDQEQTWCTAQCLRTDCGWCPWKPLSKGQQKDSSNCNCCFIAYIIVDQVKLYDDISADSLYLMPPHGLGLIFFARK